jgi:hypothetical protein
MKYIVISISLFLFGAIGFWCDLEKDWDFSRDCGSHLAYAVNANTNETAIEQLDVVIKWLEDNKFTSGNTGTMNKTISTDIYVWYKGLLEARSQLKTADPKATYVERTKMMETLRSSILKHPWGMEYYPNNWFWSIYGTIAFFSLFFGFFGFFGTLIYHEMTKPIE